MRQTITRKGSFDVCHRVMNEQQKCFNVHGHTYLYELTFAFDQMEEIGYAIDFKEIKRVGCQWIDDILDHGAILNPHDTTLINATKALDGKLWLMSLNGEGCYCNPTVENIAREILLAQKVLFKHYDHLCVQSIRLYETPNCFTDCNVDNVSSLEEYYFNEQNLHILEAYRDAKGIVCYDDKKR